VLCCSAVALAEESHNRLSEEQREQGWQLLFDGSTLDGWRRYQGGEIERGWEVVDGAITRTGRAGDIVTRRTWTDFELEFEWWVESGGNSGVFYRAGESERYIFMTAPEYQVLDDERHRDGSKAETSAGSNYALHAVERGIVRPAGNWNSGRIVVRGEAVEHWLNGKPVVAYVLGSGDWSTRVAESKFADWPKYGTLASGHIGLQDHGDRVAYRNIRIREHTH